MNENVDIFVYSHIPFTPLVTNKTYKVLTHTDGEIGGNLEVYRDYEGDNIGDMNLMYNEYTGLYWVWKNYPLKDYIGLNHYRRYFSWMNDLPDIPTLFNYCKMMISEPMPLKCPLDGKMLNNREWYAWWHNIEDYDNLRKLMEDMYPQYMDGFEEMEKRQEIYPSSMFILPKDKFIEYCNFIFPLLEEYRKRYGLMNVEQCIQHVRDNEQKYMKTIENCGYELPYYSVEMQSRIVGYVAERAMNAFIMSGGDDSLEANSSKIRWVLTVNAYSNKI